MIQGVPAGAPLAALLAEVRACTLCAPHLPHAPRPVLQASASARVLIVGQAPGRKVHETGVPFNDASGERLRDWLGVSRDTFYDPTRIALLPMGFCYPGTAGGADLPPRPECAATWRARLLAQLPAVRLTILLGRYALDWHLRAAAGRQAAGRQATGRHAGKVADIVARWRDTAPTVFPLPHPSPRNRLWCRRHPWFEAELLPVLRAQLQAVLA